MERVSKAILVMAKVALLFLAICCDFRKKSPHLNMFKTSATFRDKSCPNRTKMQLARDIEKCDNNCQKKNCRCNRALRYDIELTSLFRSVTSQRKGATWSLLDMVFRAGLT